jgi:hypothetical protein
MLNTGLILRCKSCPNSYCEDHCPPEEHIRYVGEQVPEFAALDYWPKKMFYFIECPDCMLEPRQPPPPRPKTFPKVTLPSLSAAKKAEKKPRKPKVKADGPKCTSIVLATKKPCTALALPNEHYCGRHLPYIGKDGLAAPRLDKDSAVASVADDIIDENEALEALNSADVDVFMGNHNPDIIVSDI